jgi:hypothetical protein
MYPGAGFAHPLWKILGEILLKNFEKLVCEKTLKNWCG